MPKCKYLWLVQKSKMASKNMKPFLAEVWPEPKMVNIYGGHFRFIEKDFSKP